MAFVAALLLLINAARVTPLKVDPTLTIIAESRAQYLCDKPLSHDYLYYWTSWTKFDYVGENLAKGYSSASSTHLALMKSPTHKANIVNKKFSRVGIAQKCGITVEEFGGFVK